MPVPAALEAQATALRESLSTGQATPPAAPPAPGEPAGQATPPPAPPVPGIDPAPAPAAAPTPALAPTAAPTPASIPDNVVDFSTFNDDAALDAMLEGDATPPVIDPAAPVIAPVAPVIDDPAAPPAVEPNAQMDELMTLVTQQQALITELQTGAAAPDATPAAPVKSVEEQVADALAAHNSQQNLEITDAERERFDDGTIEFVNKLVAKAAKTADAAHADQIAAMQATIDKLATDAPIEKTNTQVTAEKMFVNMLAASINDFDNVVASQGFNDFLANPANAITGETYRAVLSKAYAGQDAMQARKVFSTYQSMQTANPTLADMTTPAANSTTPESTILKGGPTKPSLKLSDLQAAMKLNVQNKAKMPNERYEKIRRLYDVARREGRVIDDIYVEQDGAQ